MIKIERFKPTPDLIPSKLLLQSFIIIVIGLCPSNTSYQAIIIDNRINDQHALDLYNYFVQFILIYRRLFIIISVNSGL